MKRLLKYLNLLALTIAPLVVFADNCGSLSDCYGQIGAAVAIVVIIAAGGGLILMAGETIAALMSLGAGIEAAAGEGILAGVLEEQAALEAASIESAEAIEAAEAAEVANAATAETAALEAGLSEQEAAIVGEAESVFQSEGMATLKAAAASGEEVAVEIGGRTIQYVPGMNASGMTYFEGNTFYLGPQAFASEAELGKTILQELFRLSTSESAGGIFGELAGAETDAAASFAEKAIQFLF